jgi:hypothetical protein
MPIERIPNDLFNSRKPLQNFFHRAQIIILTLLAVCLIIAVFNRGQILAWINARVSVPTEGETDQTPNAGMFPVLNQLVELTSLADASLEEELFPKQEEIALPLVVEEEKEKKETVSPLKNRTEEIQSILKRGGFYKGKIDGKSGPMTIQAIKDFQKSKRLKVDGVVGEKTWQELLRLRYRK